jgi:hypothetical protein
MNKAIQLHLLGMEYFPVGIGFKKEGDLIVCASVKNQRIVFGLFK